MTTKEYKILRDRILNKIAIINGLNQLDENEFVVPNKQETIRQQVVEIVSFIDSINPEKGE